MLVTYIVDWGKQRNGGRYGLIQAASMEDALWSADHIDWPDSIAVLNIPTNEEGIQYMEIDKPEKPFAGSYLSELNWKKPVSCFA